MKERHEWNYSFCEQAVYEFLIEFYAGGVYWVVPSAEGDDSTPGDREAVGFCPRELEKSDVF